ncbi:MAG: hypothetical protein ABSE16_18685 [Verrucomicrobiota bacterium]|jgi:hypothetical protein
MKTYKFATALAGAILAMGVLVPARAQDTKVDPTGTYIWTMPGRNGGPDRTNTLTLKLDGDKLTGNLTVPGPGGQTSKVPSMAESGGEGNLILPGRGGQNTTTTISDGKITGAAVSFCVVRSFNDNSVTNKYSGTLADSVIKGKIESERNGEAQSRDWEAKLQK